VDTSTYDKKIADLESQHYKLRVESEESRLHLEEAEQYILQLQAIQNKPEGEETLNATI
jgi:hypothetical protein